MVRLISVLVVLLLTTAVLADEASDRVAEAQRRLAEKQKAVKETAAKAVTQPANAPATKPAVVRARRVAFIIDARSSMLNKMRDVQEQVMLAIGELKPDQSFGIVVMSDGKAKAWLPEMIPATPANADRASGFIQAILATGPTAPSKGFSVAEKLRPDLAWFISNGVANLESPDVIVGSAKTAAATHFKINTVWHFADDDESKELLRKIASVTGGICLSERGEIVPEPPPPTPAERPTGPSIFKEGGAPATAPKAPVQPQTGRRAPPPLDVAPATGGRGRAAVPATQPAGGLGEMKFGALVDPQVGMTVAEAAKATGAVVAPVRVMVREDGAEVYQWDATRPFYDGLTKRNQLWQAGTIVATFRGGKLVEYKRIIPR